MEPTINFNAQTVAPSQGSNFKAHPVGKHLAAVKTGEVKPTKDGKGRWTEVTFETQAGTITRGYNMWPSPAGKDPNKTFEIAQGELSALCHAVGFYHIQTPNFQELHGRQLMIEVDYQEQSEEDKKANKPPYTQIVRLYDAQGNEPGKAGTAAPAAAPQMAPAPAANGWGQQPATAAPAQQGWAAPTSAAPAAAPASTGQSTWSTGVPTPAAGPAWGQAPAAGASPPWAQNG